MTEIILSKLITLGLGLNISIFATYNVDSNALAQARAASKRLTNEKIKEVLFSESLKKCVYSLMEQAEGFSRRNKLNETALWVTEPSRGVYSCHFWPIISNRRMKVEWDGYLPDNTLFSIHTHPNDSGGPRPSESDLEFNNNLGIIGLILSYNVKNISVNYPGQDGYEFIIKSKEFKRLKLSVGRN